MCICDKVRRADTLPPPFSKFLDPPMCTIRANHKFFFGGGVEGVDSGVTRNLRRGEYTRSLIILIDSQRRLSGLAQPLVGFGFLPRYAYAIAIPIAYTCNAKPENSIQSINQSISQSINQS